MVPVSGDRTPVALRQDVQDAQDRQDRQDGQDGRCGRCDRSGAAGREDGPTRAAFAGREDLSAPPSRGHGDRTDHAVRGYEAGHWAGSGCGGRPGGPGQDGREPQAGPRAHGEAGSQGDRRDEDGCGARADRPDEDRFAGRAGGRGQYGRGIGQAQPYAHQDRGGPVDPHAGSARAGRCPGGFAGRDRRHGGLAGNPQAVGPQAAVAPPVAVGAQAGSVPRVAAGAQAGLVPRVATGQARRALGRYGEDLAVRCLARAGMTVLARNWRCREGEIDIVALDAGALVVCEVKTRRGSSFEPPMAAVTPRKAARLRRLAAHWLARHGGPPPGGVRIDLVGVVLPGRGAPVVEHVRGAA
jgi:putative endonuclease